uniref:uncharacterized protein LOC120339136 n=1 Tax=Styela clava TaxID=7725 RepID=UPI00193ACD19|nr:uncharacterized protein LOC120339136 [Styela clava]
MEDATLKTSAVGDRGGAASVVIETIYPIREDEVSPVYSADKPLTIMIEQNSEGEESYEEPPSEGFVSRHVSCSRKRKLEAKFLDKKSVISLLLESESNISIIPCEPESNQYYLLKDNRNYVYGRRRTSRNTFNVDNHKWDYTSLKKHYYVFSNGEFKYVDFIGGQYLIHVPKMSQDKTERQPMSCQPEPEKILIMRKWYGSIRGILKRRISYIEKFPAGIKPKQQNLILVEYCEDVDHHLQRAKMMKIEGCNAYSSIFQPEEENINMVEPSLKDSSFFHLTSINLKEVGNCQINMGGNNNGLFFDKDRAIEILLNAETSLDEIPQGLKENEYFIINNEDNYRRALEGKRRTYIDDCGVWKNVSMKKHLYTLIDDKYVYVDYTGGKYKISNLTLRAQTEKNLEKSQIFVMRKVYGSLKRDENYKRRICWIDEFPEGVFPKQKNIALVEYIGKYPNEDVPHGNQKLPGGLPYVRTSAKLMKELKEKVVHKTAKEIIKEIGLDSNPKNIKQLQNLRYRSNLKISAGSANDQVHNDELQQVLAMVHGHSYVQQCICTKYKPPVVIAYTSQQMNSFKYRCQEKSGLNRVLGIDRTLNVGPISLTILTYPQPNLLCRKTSQPAVMMGPVFLHIDKSCQTYTLLFNHIKGCLLEAEKADIDGISVACKPEEEKAIINALNFSFPAATVTHCVDHMKMDLRDHLSSEICLPDDVADNIIKQMFSTLRDVLRIMILI